MSAASRAKKERGGKRNGKGQRKGGTLAGPAHLLVMVLELAPQLLLLLLALALRFAF